ncbi:hypothetical protein [Mucilaginibacter gotjawali]|uniref:Uncharacterized protein n=2 Tax=Mucilaginibacter gotjawali TaxID=1550579 RepID=A0A839SHR4_9SPHI|nr:hypothetical protein [Mucilaginibacter gotjawali]MBB3056833.1 hypothetical protein [Mucilaginibacter gotjawali]BAU55913.1 hypothetical protein MgSA37_04105 [Mucilaginibacter gotjawali]
MNKLLITGFLIFSSLRGFSTCIAIYIAPNGHIYVAADSRRTFYLDDDKTRTESICKIHNVGNTYFAIAGFDDGGLLTAANNALGQNNDPDAAIEAFGAAMTAHYQHLMDEAQQFYPEMLKRFLANGLAEVAFFGYTDGRARVMDVQFRVYLKKNKPVVRCRVLPVGFLAVIGISKDIDDAAPDELPAKQTMLQKPDLYVQQLVELEAAKQPLTVGGPIDLLELSPDGAVWIKKSNSGATIQ